MIFELTENIQLSLLSYLELSLIVFAFIVLNVTLLLSYKRIGRSARFAVITMINVISFCALIGLISDIKIKADVDSAQVLLSVGTNQQHIDSLSLDSNKTIFLMAPLSSWHESLDLSRIQEHLVVIDNAVEILVYQPVLSQLTIYGDGLLPQQWQALLNINTEKSTQNKLFNIEFIPSKPRTGPINLKWPKQLILGQPFTIQGVFKAAAKDENRIYKVILSDHHDETVDELRVKNKEGFNLSTLSKNEGLFVYTLKVFDDNQQLVLAEPIAFTVTSAEKIKVVIKQSSASFESKHVKNWLAEQGEEVVVITQISKDKHIQQTVNLATNKVLNPNKESMSQQTNIALTASWLKHFNILYMDGRAFLNLTDKELEQLDIAIKQGLGLIVIVDDELITSATKSTSNFLLNNVLKSKPLFATATNNQSLNTIARWLNSQEELIVSYKKATLSSVHGDAFIHGSDGQPLWVNHSYGLGSVAFSLINSSYQWVTSGAKTHYSQYWQYVIEQTGRQQKNSTWQDEPQSSIRYQGQSQPICAQLNKDDFDKVNAKEVNLLASFATESKYCGRYWSNTRGWQTFNLIDGENIDNQQQEKAPLKSTLSSKQQSSYFYGPQDWSTWQQYVKHTASVLAVKTNQNAPIKITYNHLNKKTLWLLFFICLSFLWLERKVF